jgi:hypothetical protein
MMAKVELVVVAKSRAIEDVERTRSSAQHGSGQSLFRTNFPEPST